MLYRVKKIKNPFNAPEAWDTAPWKDISPLVLTRHMGPRPEHFPRTQVRLIYDDGAVFVMFRVEDQYVRAKARHHQDPVFEDSCVEFFFTPGTDISKGYFNLEMNCAGFLLFHFQTRRGKDRVVIPREECEQIVCVHSQPGQVDPEIQTPLIWTVSCRLPVSLLEPYTEVTRPAPGVQWRTNFYKCGDKTSHPHWLTWSLVDVPKPDFHRPEFFGTLEFD